MVLRFVFYIISIRESYLERKELKSISIREIRIRTPILLEIPVELLKLGSLKGYPQEILKIK